MGKKHAVEALVRPPLEWEEGLQLVLQKTRIQRTDEAALQNATGLICAEEISSGINVPPFDNSSMDGYALTARDCAGATRENPVEIKVIGRSAAGAPFDGRVGRGEAVEIMTGAPVPEGADAVIRLEWTRLENTDRLLVLEEVQAGSCIRRAGADTAQGAQVCAAGERITPGVAGLLASCGIVSVPVFRKPTIALCTGGDELVTPAREAVLAPGQIFDANYPMLLALLRSWGFELEFLGRMPDNPDEIIQLLRKGLEYDYLVTVGGVSVGRHDYVRQCLADLGCEEIFWRLNQQPGGPLLFCSSEKTLVLGMPGNPVSCYVCAELYLKPSLLKAAGFSDYLPLRVKVRLANELRKPHSKTAFLRGKLHARQGDIWAETTGPQDSNLIRSVSHHDGYIIFPARTEKLDPGSYVDFIVSNEGAYARCAAEAAEAKRRNET